jgi:hypothetical protein
MRLVKLASQSSARLFGLFLLLLVPLLYPFAQFDVVIINMVLHGHCRTHLGFTFSFSLRVFKEHHPGVKREEK